MAPLLRVQRVVFYRKGLLLARRVVRNDQLDRVQHSHGPLRCLVQVLP